MKGTAAIVVLVLLILACAGLTYQLVQTQKKSDLDLQDASSRISVLTTNLQSTSGQLQEQQVVNAKLEKEVSSRTADLETTSNRLEAVRTELARALAKAEADARAAQEAIEQKQAQIKELEGQNQNLNSRMTDLTTAIDELEKQMADIERKLAASEGDREFLLAELKRLQQEKLELERQFNDLALLRDQIRKLRDELSIASRLEWIRRGLYGPQPQGTEKLQPGFATPPGQGSVDLDVEIRQEGGSRVIPPATPGSD
jgi:chromosome segregation ATPase